MENKMEQRIKVLEKEIESIKARNRRVEADKAWETSWSRKIAIAIVTYLFMSLLMVYLNTERPFISSFIPTGGYLLSTFSLGKLKEWWLHRRAT